MYKYLTYTPDISHKAPVIKLIILYGHPLFYILNNSLLYIQIYIYSGI